VSLAYPDSLHTSVVCCTFACFVCSGVKDIFLKLLRPGLNYRRAFSDHVDKVRSSFSSVALVSRASTSDSCSESFLQSSICVHSIGSVHVY
jgi:hypothetical protein